MRAIEERRPCTPTMMHERGLEGNELPSEATGKGLNGGKSRLYGKGLGPSAREGLAYVGEKFQGKMSGMSGGP